MKQSIAVFSLSYGPFNEADRIEVEQALLLYDRVVVTQEVKGTSPKWRVKLPKGAEYFDYHNSRQLLNLINSLDADILMGYLESF